jgi:hypothetical protein
MPEQRSLDQNTLSKARLASAFWGAFFGFCLTLFPYYGFVGSPTIPVYLFLIGPFTVGLAYVFYRISEDWISRNRDPVVISRDLLDENELQELKEEQENKLEKMHYRPVTKFSEMEGISGTLFKSYVALGSFIRAITILGGGYLLASRSLPDNLSSIPFSNWTIEIVAGLLFSVIFLMTAVGWWTISPKIENHHTWEDNPYNLWWSFAAVIIGALYLVFFI